MAQPIDFCLLWLFVGFLGWSGRERLLTKLKSEEMVRVGRCRVLLGNEGALNWPNVSVCLCVCAGVGVWVVNEWV